jgi:acyl-CoA hydrolase
MAPKRVAESRVVTTNLVLPNDTNQLGNLLGGTIMHWIDVCAAIAAQRHSGHVCVTASVDDLVFHDPIKLGDVVTLTAFVTRAFHSSMEIGVTVGAVSTGGRQIARATSAFLTFVAIDEAGRTVAIPPLLPENDEEKLLFDQALVRRELRLKHRQS